MDSTSLVGPFQLRTFCDSVTDSVTTTRRKLNTRANWHVRSERAHRQQRPPHLLGSCSCLSRFGRPFADLSRPLLPFKLPLPPFKRPFSAPTAPCPPLIAPPLPVPLILFSPVALLTAAAMEDALRRALGTAVLRPTGHSGGGCISQGRSYDTDHGRVFVKSSCEGEVWRGRDRGCQGWGAASLRCARRGVAAGAGQ